MAAGAGVMRRVLLALLFAVAAHAQPADELLGLWSGEAVFPQPLQGELTVWREGGRWRASIAGVTATSRDPHFTFAHGELRGRLEGDELRGFWIQPPGGTAQRFASPIAFRAAGKDRWRGVVRPVDDRFTLFLKVFYNEDGILVGAFRNPEQNAVNNAPRFRIDREAAKIAFHVRYDEERPEIRFEGELVAPDRLRLRWAPIDRQIELTRCSPSEASAFFPRPASTYVYRRPPAMNDGWDTASAADAGLDEAVLARLVQRLIDADPAARRPSLIHSLLVARHGKLVLEEYFFGFDRDTLHDTRSAGKTFASIMLGATNALTPETPLFSVMKGSFANPDPRKAQITIGQLLTHTSGLACDDNDEESPGNEDTMQRQTGQPDWIRYALDLPMAHDPGTRYAYCSAGMNLVGGALSVATKTWLPELFDRSIGRPLQFGPYAWNLMPNGEGYQGGGAFLRPRDLLKIGQTYLDGGVWRGRRVVPADWVKRSTSKQTAISPATTGLSPEAFSNSYNEAEDGFAWHLYQLKVGDRTFAEYEAAGNGGQLLMVVPERDLVVVITAGLYGQGGIWGRFRDQLVAGEILPATR